MIFFLVGYGPQSGIYKLQKNNDRIPVSMVVSTIMIVLLVVPLTAFALTSFQTSSIENSIGEEITSYLSNVEGVTDVSVVVNRVGEIYHVNATVRTVELLQEAKLLDLGKTIQVNVDEKIYLLMDQIFVTPITIN